MTSHAKNILEETPSSSNLETGQVENAVIENPPSNLPLPPPPLPTTSSKDVIPEENKKTKQKYNLRSDRRTLSWKLMNDPLAKMNQNRKQKNEYAKMYTARSTRRRLSTNRVLPGLSLTREDTTDAHGQNTNRDIVELEQMTSVPEVTSNFENTEDEASSSRDAPVPKKPKEDFPSRFTRSNVNLTTKIAKKKSNMAKKKSNTATLERILAQKLHFLKDYPIRINRFQDLIKLMEKYLKTSKTFHHLRFPSKEFLKNRKEVQKFANKFRFQVSPISRHYSDFRKDVAEGHYLRAVGEIYRRFDPNILLSNKSYPNFPELAVASDGGHSEAVTTEKHLPSTSLPIDWLDAEENAAVESDASELMLDLLTLAETLGSDPEELTSTSSSSCLGSPSADQLLQNDLTSGTNAPTTSTRSSTEEPFELKKAKEYFLTHSFISELFLAGATASNGLLHRLKRTFSFIFKNKNQLITDEMQKEYLVHLKIFSDAEIISLCEQILDNWDDMEEFQGEFSKDALEIIEMSLPFLEKNRGELKYTNFRTCCVTNME